MKEKMDNQIQVFSSEQFGSVRTMIIDDEPWFVLSDICTILGISHVKDTAARLDEDEVGQTEVIDKIGRRQKVNIVNESGFYNAVIRSDKPIAKPFRKWVTSEVLPSIRKTGGYVSNDELFIATYLPNVDESTKNLFRLNLQTIRQLNAKVDTQAKKIEADKPKVEFAEQVHDSTNLSSIEDFAKALHDEDIHIGRNKLYKWLRENKYLMHDNVPYQQFIDRGLFAVTESTYSAKGEIRTAYTTRITGKGQLYITAKLRQYWKT